MTEIVQSTVCLECEANIEATGEILVGEILTCQDCGTELEVVATNPLTIEVAPEVEEDWGE